MKIGCVNSKTEKDGALRLCKERKMLIKVAIDSRHAFAAAHLSYIQSLRNIGVALRRYAEAEMLLESSLSISDHTPSLSTYPSPSPSESPLNNESHHHVSYMKTGGSEAVNVMIDPHAENLWVDEAIESDASWDFFDAADSAKSSEFTVHASHYKDEEETGSFLENDYCNLPVECCRQKGDGEMRKLESSTNVGVVGRSSSKNSKNVAVNTEREDPSEFISHRAKDFLSSVKVIKHRFVRASESGREVSRLLEANKIKVGYSEPKVGKSPATIFLATFMFACFSENAIPAISQEPAQKIISWKRTESSQSASMRNPLVKTSETYMDDSGSDFVEEPCMISGSHSCTLERLYAWERKLYDEVKAGEFIRKKFDRKCDQLRHQFAKDESSRVIDKTRSIVKDLHSQIIVAIYSADLISKRIEMIRDEELFPQLLEFTQGAG
ncbi:nitrate regulatory gene2 protein-like isoform X3 [Vigna unguiculata]|uniref:nitrate regulatory gene2 protein-like isoform X3 n=1 Tax=Vigna unguiculata TaxID=3917 RepID=UPI001015CBCF|nr:nitrate regulatory gene2 protein-like isoform X3 [Vigna unguiculata]